MEFDLENPLPNSQHLQSDYLPSLFASESDHMPCQSYISTFKTKNFDISIRRQAISLILQVQFSCKFDPFISYLAINYLDRFISQQEEIQEEKPWILKLVSLSCVSLSTKMKQLAEISITDFQKEEGFIFDAQTIHRMELLILGSLKWRMRSITPFSFLNFFLSLLPLKDPALLQSLKARSAEIIFKSQFEIEVLQFKPSIVAASAVLSACYELLPLQFPGFRNSISSCVYVNKEKVIECCNVMKEIVMDGHDSMMDMVSSSQTPDNVLDFHCSSSESEKATKRSERETKRRKLSDFKTLQLSHITPQIS